MDSLLLEFRRVLSLWASTVYTRLSNFLHTAPPGAVQLTGVLGLAAVLVGYYQFRGNNNDNQRPSRAARRSSNAPAAAAGSSRQPAPSTSTEPKAVATNTAAAVPQNLSPTATAVRLQLAGVRRITISAAGVLLEQILPTQLQESATLRSGVAAMIKEVASYADVYVITHVDDDVGQAAVQGVLEDAGIVGTGQGCIKPHKLLFCSTADGKISIVRQLEPDLHIDAAVATVQELKRFLPQLLHVTCGGSMAAAGAPNVVHCKSLGEFFGL